MAFISSFNHIHPSRRGTQYEELISATDWRKTIVKAAGIDQFHDPGDDGIDYWNRLQQQANSNPEPAPLRKELPLQVWREANRVVVLFYFEGDLWKIMKGYPAAASGNGYLYKTRVRYSLSEIEQPLELPKSEWTIGLQDGRGLRFECKPYCLSSLSKDPSELKDWKSTSPQALSFGINLARKYEKQGPSSIEQTGLCESNFYARPSKDVTDAWSIMQASKCGAFLPWLDEKSSIKSSCGK